MKAEAGSLREALEKEFGVTVPVRSGAPGSLTVVVDGERVYSRKERSAPLASAAIVELVRAKSAQA